MKGLCNVNLHNSENLLQKNLRTDRTREYIFRASGDTNFEIYLLSTTNHGGILVGSIYVLACPRNSRFITDIPSNPPVLAFFETSDLKEICILLSQQQ